MDFLGLKKLRSSLNIEAQEYHSLETIVQIFQFINPFHEKYNYLKRQDILLYHARDVVLQLFKSAPVPKKLIKLANQNKESESPSIRNKEPSDSQNRFFSYEDENTARMILFEKVPISVKKQFPWILQPLSKKNKSQSMTKHDFNIMIISIVLNTVNNLGYKYKLLKSRNEEEFFVKVVAEENVLITHAKNMQYRLRFRDNEKWTKKFQKVPPFGPIWLLDNDHNVFVKYDENGLYCNDGGSLFTFTDKYRIVNRTLAQIMDLNILKSRDLIISSFVPHEEIPKAVLQDEWATFKNLFNEQPIEKIKTYFSEQVAFYFCWMDTYKNFMTFSAIVGTAFFLCGKGFDFFGYKSIALLLNVVFCLFIAIWAISFEQFWVRKEKLLAWEWGTIDFTDQEIQREQFKGVYVKDEVTGKDKMVKSDKGKYQAIKALSISTVILFIAIVTIAVILIFQFRVYLLKLEEWRSKAPIITAIIYAINIIIFDFLYTYIAKILTIWENHETINEYNNSFALKLFLFRFVNSYSGLFYIAFFKKASEGQCGFEECYDELGFQLTIIFITNMALNIIELGLPWFLACFRKKKERIEVALKTNSAEIRSDYYKIENEAMLEPYDYVIEDYMEMCLQYGFVALFGASFPLISVLALIEIYIEIRVDAIKLCKFVKRPEPVKTEDIGIWKGIILFITVFGVISNSGLIIITSDLLEPMGWKDELKILIIFEHVLLFVIIVMRYVIPDTPSRVLKGKTWSRRIVKDFMAGKGIENNKYSEYSKKSSEFYKFYLDQAEIHKYN